MIHLKGPCDVSTETALIPSNEELIISRNNIWPDRRGPSPGKHPPAWASNLRDLLPCAYGGGGGGDGGLRRPGNVEILALLRLQCHDSPALSRDPVAGVAELSACPARREPPCEPMS